MCSVVSITVGSVHSVIVCSVQSVVGGVIRSTYIIATTSAGACMRAGAILKVVEVGVGFAHVVHVLGAQPQNL